MAKSLGLAEIPTLNPDGDEVSRFDQAILKVINENFKRLANALGRVSGLVDLFENIKTAEVDTSETTSSTSYADLATLGPAVTCVTRDKAVVFLHCQTSASSAIFMGVAVSGDTTIAASDTDILFFNESGNRTCAAMAVITGLNSGTNTFTAKYKVGSGTQTFLRRKITVLPVAG